ncbi:DUF2225 domain-containing protein [Spirochaeta isovalerica]|uniref:DUF2225 domain-containing protein n=1 Tax=Spirochaeta isovalerica TaxID=150 RepID=A0A841R6H8_9SPIO|nr:DUF2225 domain-containing protein [Spirochaeta isovalerica]MBB6480804.1 hypothetical protein [Spirochaeta isovalerica]
MAENPKISFFAKNKTVCPVCGTEFYRENLLSGGGRMNAGQLTLEMHRLYEPTQKFGKVYPLLYPVAVCPECFTAAFEKDFLEMENATVTRLQSTRNDRKGSVEKLFPGIDFTQNRGLKEGIASYILAMITYDSFPAEFTPTFKQAMCTLRAAWLCRHQEEEEPGENFDYLARIFYRKASFFYRQVVENEQTGKESVETIGNFGPDIDNNYGFDGVMYLAGLLEFYYGPRENVQVRLQRLKNSMTVVSRIVGMRKSSKSKPSTLVENAIELHGKIKEEIKKLENNP